MARKGLSNIDASSELNYVISSQDRGHRPIIPKVTAEEAMNEESVLDFASDRDVTRVLFISRNTELLNPTQQSLDGYIDLSDLFDEVHILILREGIPPKYPVLRVADNVWIYTATAKTWWGTQKAGMEMIENELEFASGFRADLIVARDPFESAWLASRVGRKYGRPIQLHILDDYTSEDFIEKKQIGFFRRLIPNYVIPKFASIRTETSAIKNVIKSKFKIEDLSVLPHYQNYEELIELDSKIDLKEKYKPFIFFIVFIGKLGYKSSLHKIIDAIHDILRNPRVGLLVLGDGPAKGEIERKIRSLSLSGQVVFETKVKDVVPYLKSSHILLVSDTDLDSEEVVLKGAASGVAMVLSKTEKREDAFNNGESAFLCNKNNIEEYREAINELLNDFDLRQKFAAESQNIIRRKFFADPKKYVIAYRASIEQAFFVGEAEDSSSIVNKE